jgi:cation diffusion facilitator CzcD-associated flavoprotein CzcO
VLSAHFNERIHRWDVETDKGDRYSAKFLITGLGILSAPNKPPFPGEERFEGRILHTANWPREPIDFRGKRIGVIGNGSTGVQVVTELASQVNQLTLFQRSPQYSVPAQNHPLDHKFLESIADNLEEYFDRVCKSATVFAFEHGTVGAMEVAPEERERVFEKAWNDGGGFNFMFGTFNDIAVNRESNAAACQFIRRKISEIVTDPAKLEVVMPTDLYARRPLCDNGYYQALNRDNVSVMSIRKNPIIEFTEKGIRTSAGEVELDYVIFATGFDAVTGNFTRIDFQGRNGVKMGDHWAKGPRAFLGLSAAGFPNMFALYGPPGPFTNQPSAARAADLALASRYLDQLCGLFGDAAGLRQIRAGQGFASSRCPAGSGGAAPGARKDRAHPTGPGEVRTMTNLVGRTLYRLGERLPGRSRRQVMMATPPRRPFGRNRPLGLRTQERLRTSTLLAKPSALAPTRLGIAAQYDVRFV